MDLLHESLLVQLLARKAGGPGPDPPQVKDKSRTRPGLFWTSLGQTRPTAGPNRDVDQTKTRPGPGAKTVPPGSHQKQTSIGPGPGPDSSIWTPVVRFPPSAAGGVRGGAGG